MTLAPYEKTIALGLRTQEAQKNYKKLDGFIKKPVNVALAKMEERADELGLSRVPYGTSWLRQQPCAAWQKTAGYSPTTNQH